MANIFVIFYIAGAVFQILNI